MVDDDAGERLLEPHDVAVITPHVEQASAVAARLADLPGVLIGTANQAQGTRARSRRGHPSARRLP